MSAPISFRRAQPAITVAMIATALGTWMTLAASSPSWAASAPNVTSPVDGTSQVTRAVKVTGTGLDGDKFVVTENGDVLCSDEVDREGNWHCTVPALSLGVHTLAVSSQPATGQSATRELTVTIVHPVHPSVPPVDPPPVNPPPVDPPPVNPPPVNPPPVNPPPVNPPPVNPPPVNPPPVNPPPVNPPPVNPPPVNEEPVFSFVPETVQISAASSTFLAWSFELLDESGLALTGDVITAGLPFMISSSGLSAGATVDAVVHSTPQFLGSAVIGEDGLLRLPVRLPENLEAGAHEIVLTLTTTSGFTSTRTHAIRVVGASTVIDSAGAPDATDPPAKFSTVPSHTRVDTGSATRERSDGGALSKLQTLFDVSWGAAVLGVAGSVAVAFILLVALPAELLQSTIAANYNRAFGWLEPLRRRSQRWRDALPHQMRDGRVVGLVTVAATAWLLGFSDPSFGWDGASIRTWIATFAGLYVINVVVSVVLQTVAFVRYGVKSRLEPMPAGLFIVVGSVLVSRLAGIEPGFLFGLVVGVAFAIKLKREAEGKLALLGASIMISLGVGAWILYSLIDGGNGFALSLAKDTLAAITLEALSTLLVVLAPFKFLDGKAIWEWSRRAWLSAYGIAVAVFVLVVVPMSDNWGDMTAPLLGWFGLFALFALVALGVWAYFRFVPPREGATEHEVAEAEAAV